MKPKNPAPKFHAFTPATLAFLNRLAQHNNREWFHAHKAQFEAAVITPALDFIEAMGAPLATLSPHFLAIPKKVGGSLFRIYRDTRFAHDKRPYKTNIGIHFRHDANRDVHAPGYYFHIGADECFLACGMWHPERPNLTKIRTALLERPKEWATVRRSLARAACFELSGESLKRLPRDLAIPAGYRWVDDLRRKDFILLRRFDEGILYSEELLDFTVNTYKSATPFMKFLCLTQGVKF